MFPEPGAECIAVENGDGVAAAIEAMSSDQAEQMGELARQRVLAEYTHTQRAAHVERCLSENLCPWGPASSHD